MKHFDSDPGHVAKVYLIKWAQRQHYGHEIEFLENPSGRGPPELVENSNLFSDQSGIVRSRTRIDKTIEYQSEVKYPILLPKYSAHTKLIVQECHNDCKHLDIAATLCKLRLSGYSLPHARKSIKHYIADCFVCGKYNALSFRYTRLTNLPKDRVNIIRSFLHTGVDFTGHMWIHTGKEGDKKVYLLVFTCLSVRAIHIEMLQDMSAKSFVLALIKFTNLFGIPVCIYSDNARSFVAGCNTVKKYRISLEFQDRFGTFEIKHLPILLYARWMGSVWERLIKTIKLCLYKAVGRKAVEFYDLLTLLLDIQNTINFRPLTYRCSSDKGIDIVAPVNFISSYIKEGVILRMAEDESSTFFF